MIVEMTEVVSPTDIVNATLEAVIRLLHECIDGNNR